MGYGFNDFFSTSPAEDLRNQYENLLSRLDRGIRTVKNTYTDVETLLTNGFTTTDKGISECEGMIPELLLTSLAKTKEEFMRVLSTMSTAIDALEKKQAIVSRRVEQLNGYCRKEDNREKEYTYSEIYLD